MESILRRWHIATEYFVTGHLQVNNILIHHDGNRLIIIIIIIPSSPTIQFIMDTRCVMSWQRRVTSTLPPHSSPPSPNPWVHICFNIHLYNNNCYSTETFVSNKYIIIIVRQFIFMALFFLFFFCVMVHANSQTSFAFRIHKRGYYYLPQSTTLLIPRSNLQSDIAANFADSSRRWFRFSDVSS